MIASLERIVPLAMGVLALVASASTARGQGNTFNPYGNSGYADYREFGNPVYANNPSLPGQSRLNGEPIITRPRANSFQQFADSIDGGGTTAPLPRGASANLPYTQAYRQYDKEYDRVYRPNAKADEGFDARLKKRDQMYARAMTEKDPAKRARMLRELEMDSLDRRPSVARTTPATKGAQTKGANPTAKDPLSRAPNPFTPAPGTGSSSSPRATAPSPYPARPRATGAEAASRTPSAARGAPATGSPAAPATRRGSGIGLPPDPSTFAVPPPR